MQAVVCHGPRDYRLEDVPVPEPGPGEALVRVEAVRHLRLGPEVLPRGGEVLGRRQPPGLGGDRA